MAKAEFLKREEEFLSSSVRDLHESEGVKSRGQLIEKKIEILENLAGKEQVHAFIRDGGDKDVLVLHIQDPFRRLLLHGVCEFYNLISVTVTTLRDAKLWKTMQIKKKAGSPKMPPNIRLVQFLKMAKEGAQ